jgi:hypothetical protein
MACILHKRTIEISLIEVNRWIASLKHRGAGDFAFEETDVKPTLPIDGSPKGINPVTDR